MTKFHFQILHIEVQKNVVSDLLSSRLHMSTVCITYRRELDEIQEKYIGGLFCKDDELLPGG